MSSQVKIIVVSGIDGSGKTTIIQAIRDVLVQKGQESRYVWLRYNHYLTKFLLAFCRLIGLTRYEHFENSRVGYHNFHKSTLISWLFIILTYIDTLAVSVIKVYIPARFSKSPIICDRWVYDIMIDLEVDTGIDFSEGTLVAKFFKRLIPENSLYFFIQRDFDAVQRVRDESMNDRNFPRRFNLYEKHSHDKGVKVIHNNGPLEETVRQVVQFIS